jgi:hypothetical protein
VHLLALLDVELADRLVTVEDAEEKDVGFRVGSVVVGTSSRRSPADRLVPLT